MHGLFGTKHIILIIISLALVAALYILLRRIDFKKAVKLMLCIGIISEIIKIFYYIIRNEETYGGFLPKTDLPFQLCSIQIIFIAVLNYSENEKLKRMLISFMMPSCLIGGLAALLIATTSSLNGMWIITLQYFVYHAAIMAFALYLTTSKEYGLTLKGYFSCMKFLLVIMFFAIYINGMLYDGVSNINFMYVTGPPQDGLPYLNDNNGWLSYIIRYAVLVVGAITLFYIKPIVLAAKSKISESKKVEEAGDVEKSEDDAAIK